MGVARIRHSVDELRGCHAGNYTVPIAQEARMRAYLLVQVDDRAIEREGLLDRAPVALIAGDRRRCDMLNGLGWNPTDLPCFVSLSA